MRVVIATQSLFYADGTARSSLAIAQGLRDLGHEICLVYPERPYDQPLLQPWVSLATTVRPVRELALRSQRPVGSVVGMARSMGAIRGLRGDVVYVHRTSHTLLGWLCTIGRRTRVVVHLHGHPPGRVRRWSPLRRADAYIAISQSVADAWTRSGLDALKVRVVYNGIPATDVRCTTDSERVIAREALGIDSDAEPVVGFVGRLTGPKGVWVLADAFREFAATHPTAFLVMIGSRGEKDPVTDALRQRLAGLRAITLSERDDIMSVMSAFDIGAVPSDMEGFSLVVLEYMACGVPVVGSRVGGIPEVLGPALSEHLCPPGDAMALAASMSAVAARLASDAELRNAYRDRALLFTLDDTVAGVAAVLTGD